MLGSIWRGLWHFWLVSFICSVASYVVCLVIGQQYRIVVFFVLIIGWYIFINVRGFMLGLRGG